MLGNVDTEIIKLEKAISGIQNSITKGFSSSKEVDRFDREMESIVDHVLQVKSELEKVANISLDTLPKEAKKALDEASKAVIDFKNKTAKTMKNMASASFGKGDSIFSIIAGGKFDEKMFDERKKALDIQIAQQRKIIDLKESEIIETAKLNALQKQVQNSMFSTTGGAGKLFSEFKLDKKYSQSAAGRDIRATKVDKAGRTIYTQEFNSQAERQINEIYQKILQSVILTGKGYKDFEAEFINQLKSQYAITLDPSTNFANKMKNDFLKAGNKYASTNVLKGEMQPVKSLKEELTELYSQQEVLKLLSKAGGEAAQGLAPLIQKEKDLNSVLNNNENALKGTIKDLNNLNQPINAEIQAWSGVKQELDKTAESQQKLDSGFDNIIRRATMLFSVGSVFNFIRRQISETYQDVQNLDKSFAQIAMVTSYHVEELWGNYNQYAQMANKLGQTTNDVIQASVLFYQQGLETNEVLSLTEDTMKLATLAGVDFADATDLMTAALRGFKLEMSEGSHVTDVYSELAAHAAASVNEIANAMNKTAAIANSAGMSFENTAAFLTQMINNIVPYNSDIILNCEYAGKPLELLLLSA